MTFIKIKKLPNIHTDTPRCTALKKNHMQCTRNAQVEIVEDRERIAGGEYFCAEHYALFKLKAASLNVEVEEVLG